MSAIDKVELLRRVRRGELSANQAILLLKGKPTPTDAPDTDPQAPWQERFLADLLSLIGELLGMDRAHIDLDAPVADMGLDSLSATEFSNKARQRFGISLQATVFFECRTIRDFHTHMVRHHATRLVERYTPVPRPAPPPIAAAHASETVGTIARPQRASALKASTGDPIRANLERLWSQSEIELAATESLGSLNSPAPIPVPTAIAALDRLLLSRPGQPDLEICMIGRGTPLLMLGGLMNNENIWHRQITALAPHFRLLIFNKPGCGRSGVDRILTMDSIVDDVLYTLDILAPGQVVPVVGYSFGGMVALKLLVRAPECMARIALINSTAKTQPRTDEARILVEELARCPEAAALNGSVNLAVAARYKEVSKTFDLRDALADYAHPALILTAGKDGYIPRERGLELASLLRGGRHVELPDAGHFSLLTHSEQVNAHLHSFLTEDAGRKAKTLRPLEAA